MGHRRNTMELLVAVIGLITAIASAKGVDVVRKRRREKSGGVYDYHPTEREVLRLTEVNRLLYELIMLPNVERALILHTHNGGGRPSPGFPLKVSAVHIATQGKDFSKLYKNILVDDHYTQLMAQLVSGKTLNIVVDNLPDSLIKTIYDKEGVKYSRWLWLATTSTRVYYMSISGTNPELLDHENDFNIETRIAALRAIFSEVRE